MQFLVEYETSREVINWDEDVYDEILLHHVRQTFKIHSDAPLLLQKFDPDWAEWINIKIERQAS